MWSARPWKSKPAVSIALPTQPPDATTTAMGIRMMGRGNRLLAHGHSSPKEAHDDALVEEVEDRSVGDGVLPEDTNHGE